MRCPARVSIKPMPAEDTRRKSNGEKLASGMRRTSEKAARRSRLTAIPHRMHSRVRKNAPSLSDGNRMRNSMDRIIRNKIQLAISSSSSAATRQRTEKLMGKTMVEDRRFTGRGVRMV